MARDAGGGPGGGLGDGTLTADLAALDGVRARFEELASAFADAGVPLGRQHDVAMAAAGQFRADLQPGAVKFLLSWNAVFEVASRDSRLIAGNINRTTVDLSALDTQLAAGIQL